MNNFSPDSKVGLEGINAVKVTLREIIQQLRGQHIVNFAIAVIQPDYHTSYWHKYHETPKHQHKRALVLTARKAVRLIFALLPKGQLHCREEGRLT
jgi:hypothetical protein